MILVFVLYFSWAFLLFTNKAVMTICSHPLFIGGFRSFVSGLLLFIIGCILQKGYFSSLYLSRKEWFKLSLCGIMMYGIAISGFSLGIDYVSPIAVGFIYATAPFITAILMFFIYGKKLSTNKLIGLIIGAIGLLPIILMGESSGTETTMCGVFIFMISRALYAYSWILLKEVINYRKEVALQLNSIAMMIGGFLALFASVLFKVPDESTIQLFFEGRWYFLSFIMLTTIGYGLYAYLLTKYSPTFLSFAGFLGPLFVTLLGAVLFGYPLKMLYFYSFVLLFSGLYIFYREELKASRKINKV